MNVIILFHAAQGGFKFFFSPCFIIVIAHGDALWELIKTECKNRFLHSC
jgi:uncharacterized Rossmann fold enzyme